MTSRRFPRSVYGVGDEPDPRFSLANERTFLAWIRTSLGLLAVGVAIEALKLDIDPVLRFIAALIFVVLAVIAGVHAWFSWARHEKAMRLNRALSGPSMGVVLVLGVVLATLLLVVGMLL
ncbi:YidH family protein [Microbacterium sp.]|uniref:YidH family protein n=1 Tax=Microbacterium sp. TaxID=51671 RepID=UPI003A90DF4E